MRLLLTFKEISRYVDSNYGQELDFCAVSHDTLRVTFAKKVILTTVRLSVELKIESVEPSLVRLSYSGNTGVELIISGGIKMLLKKEPKIAEAVKTEDGNKIAVDLARLGSLRSALEKIQLQAISMKDEGIEVSAKLT